jgi:hypothetical protein
MGNILFTIFLVVLASSPCFSALKTFEVAGTSFKMSLPSDWQRVVQTSKTNAIFVGDKDVDDRNPVILVSPMRLKGVQFSETVLNLNSSDYFLGRRRFVNEKRGTILVEESYKKENWAGITEAHSVGYQYRANGIDARERSYYISCSGNVFHVKLLEYKASGDKKFTAENDEIARSFTCI